ncbi:Uncharacterised protein [Mycobacterium tuberculosis]|uniref:Uncharacterized protein n=1 Tax=Mycobacterium tuberculosis TaxID=1773 RepID=A0A0T7PHN2_MYCTX|nr:Uncharacterised protein [Mycobacterium tuberculosis]CFD69743.1 Uncharacterised protein [Mycobacterium tuberculosis]CFD69761.1 Uncharacterised protein [Mycobacterium tuberculosis]CFE49028.1 Uncharacterised protein [Mycobacterium tuberculosis]CFE82561.1 Uncharacterised protein [Mycobacterium tuberculosis]
MVMPWVGAGKGSPKLGIAAVDPRIQSSPSKRMLMSGSVMVDPGEAGMSSGMVLVCAGIVVAGTRTMGSMWIDSWISSGIAGTSTCGMVKGPISTISWTSNSDMPGMSICSMWMGPRLRVSLRSSRVLPAMSMLKEKPTSPW